MDKRSGFDVVVVGGGSAGCVVAARLSESSERSILLLEAGPDRRANLPDDMRDGWHLTRHFDWGYVSEDNDLGNSQNLRRVRLLGGTSWVTRFALRGSPTDFDEWEALGNPGWSFGDVLPYFSRLETDIDLGDRAWHGDAGPVPITRYPHLQPTEILGTTVRACEAVGFPLVEDHNEPGAVGVGRMPMSSRDGIRVTTADAYLPPGSIPPTLTIRPDSQVSSVIFTGPRARGVRLLDGTVIEADRVVLCAGTYGSPAILMRSGVGPAAHLRSIGLPVRVDLAGVGENLSDHPSVFLDFGYQGPFRSTPLLHSVATFHSNGTPSSAAPDLMLWLPDPDSNPPMFGAEAVLLKPHSRGRVRLRSADPAEPPRVDLPNLREDSDLHRLIEAFRRGWEVANRPEIRDLCSDSPAPDMPDDRELGRWIRQEMYSLPHVVGTCAMGPSPEDGGVVDAWGRVHGTQHLHVVDASIMPTVPSGFTHLPVIMMAERLAEQIATQV